MLNQDDVRKLLDEPAAEARAEVAEKIAVGHGSGRFRANELLVAEQIFRLLLRDAEVQVRAALAEGLKDNAKAPHDVVQKLAADAEMAVAQPVIEYSEVLNDEDLLGIISSHNEITKHIAIANRKQVSGMVSAALVETRNADVVGHLVRNEGANIPEHSMQRIVSDHGNNAAMMAEAAQRANLPVTVVESLLNIVSESVAGELKRKYTQVADKLEREAQRARERMTLRLLDTTLDEASVTALVDQLREAGRLTPSIILTALCRGNFAFFEVSLGRMAGIPIANARRLVADKGELGFKSLYMKAGLPESMFQACRVVLSVMHELRDEGGDVTPGTIHFANRVVERIFARLEGKEIDNLSYIIALIRQNVR